MNWLKENWFWVGLLTILTLSIASAFYWYELRPSNTKKYCYDIAMEKAKEKAGRSDGKFYKDDYDTYYKLCLDKQGL